MRKNLFFLLYIKGTQRYEHIVWFFPHFIFTFLRLFFPCLCVLLLLVLWFAQSTAQYQRVYCIANIIVTVRNIFEIVI